MMSNLFLPVLRKIIRVPCSKSIEVVGSGVGLYVVGLFEASVSLSSSWAAPALLIVSWMSATRIFNAFLDAPFTVCTSTSSAIENTESFPIPFRPIGSRPDSVTPSLRESLLR